MIINSEQKTIKQKIFKMNLNRKSLNMQSLDKSLHCRNKNKKKKLFRIKFVFFSQCSVVVDE